jgi:integrase
MASLYKQNQSAYWYIAYKKEGKWVRKSTGLRWDDPHDTAEAKALRATFEAAEHKTANTKQPTSTNSWDWVPEFFTNSGIAASSITRYRYGWNWVLLFLTKTKLAPALVTYPAAEKYMEWRGSQKKKSGKTAVRNTILFELKIFAYVLSEAVRRGIIPHNPLGEMRFKKAQPRKKPALTDAEITKCVRELQTEPGWMLGAFLIALHTGCRLSETQIPMSAIDVDGTPATITFPSPKGGESKSFTVPMPTALRPLFEQMRSNKQTHTLQLPATRSRDFSRFFCKIGLRHITFHCLRVTKVTRLRREAVPREIAMRLVNHSSELIHLLYDRHQVGDLLAYANAGSPSPDAYASTVQSPSKTPPPRK